MRPLYETSGDRVAEKEIISKAEEAWGVKATKMPMKYKLDYALLRGGEVKAFAEVKNRPKFNYPTYLLSLDKWSKAIALSESTGKPSVLVVRLVDKVMYYVFSKSDLPMEIREGGRWDRGDEDDIEPVVLIPIGKFKQVLA